MERELLSEAGLRPLKLGVRVADGRPLPARWERGFEVDRCRVSPGIGDILVQMARGAAEVIAVSNARPFVRLSGRNRASQPV